MKHLKYTHYNITFQEVPNETSLIFNISGCPYKCDGCHSMYLWQWKGKFLYKDIRKIIEEYKSFITCVCFMGGDQNIEELLNFLTICKEYNLKTCLYTGSDEIEFPYLFNLLDYIKIGHYNKNLGGLNSPITNQKFYKIENLELIDLTNLFQKNLIDNNNVL